MSAWKTGIWDWILGKIDEYVGKKYGMLTVTDQSLMDEKFCIWFVCDCECGNSTMHSLKDLIAGKATNCGCKKS